MEYLQNGLRLAQAEGLFRLGTDAMVLADFARVRRGQAVCDLCAGGGAVGFLLCAADSSLRVTAVELQAEACALMERTVRENGLGGRFTVLQADLRERGSLPPAGSFRAVVCNPPYFPVGAGFTAKSEAQAVARTELCCTMDDMAAAAAWLLPEGGELWLVHRPERLAELCSVLRAHALEPKELRTVRHRPEAPAALILVRAVRGGKPGLTLRPELILAEADGSPTAEYRRIYHMEDA